MTPNLKFVTGNVVSFMKVSSYAVLVNLLNFNNSKTHFPPCFIISEIEVNLIISDMS